MFVCRAACAGADCGIRFYDQTLEKYVPVNTGSFIAIAEDGRVFTFDNEKEMYKVIKRIN